jgi:hypothetical protein
MLLLIARHKNKIFIKIMQYEMSGMRVSCIFIFTFVKRTRKRDGGNDRAGWGRRRGGAVAQHDRPPPLPVLQDAQSEVD